MEEKDMIVVAPENLDKLKGIVDAMCPRCKSLNVKYCEKSEEYTCNECSYHKDWTFFMFIDLSTLMENKQ